MGRVCGGDRSMRGVLEAPETGDEARAVGQLRGEILKDHGRQQRKEQTKDTGNHYVDVYVVKDRQVVASDRVRVRIRQTRRKSICRAWWDRHRLGHHHRSEGATRAKMAADRASRARQWMAEWRIEGQVWIEDQLEGLYRHADRVAATRREMEASADRLAPMWEDLERALSGKAAATVPLLRDLAEARSKRRRDLMVELESLARAQADWVKATLDLYRSTTPRFVGEWTEYLDSTPAPAIPIVLISDGPYRTSRGTCLDPRGRCVVCATELDEPNEPGWCGEHDIVRRYQRELDEVLRPHQAAA